MSASEMARAPVKSAGKSKINATAIAAFITTLLTGFGLKVDEALQLMILKWVGLLAPVVIVVWRTWFNRTVTPK